MSDNVHGNSNAGRWKPIGPALAAYVAQQQAPQSRTGSSEVVRSPSAEKIEIGSGSGRNPGAAAKPVPPVVTARNKLGTAFLEALQDHFARHGESAIQSVFEKDKYQYLRIIAALMPKVLPRENTSLDDMNDDQIRELLGAIRHVRSRGHGAPAAGPLGANAPRQ
jgi:hypothetical protein